MGRSMPFTVADFPDLLRLLGEHPEWQAALRRHVLTEELLELPALFRQLTARLDQLAARLEELTVRVDQLTVRVDQLAQAQLRTEQRLDQLTAQVARLVDHMADVRGWRWEEGYRRKAPSFFAPVARRLRPLTDEQRVALLDAAVAAGQLSQEEADEVEAADLLCRARLRADDQEAILVVEVSAGIGEGDVARAARRAQLLARTGARTLAVVGGRSIADAAASAAERLAVAVLLDGRPG